MKIRLILLYLSMMPLLALAEEMDEFVTPAISVLGRTGEEKSGTGAHTPTVSEISGLRLERKRAATLGETISREAGVTSSFFGPNASRPVIRGMDGERLKILQDGLGTQDASGTSPDHSVSLDPLLIERIEIVRGSGSLLYGNSAIGGAVNTVSSRIPEKLEFGTLLKENSRLSSNDLGRSMGLVFGKSFGRVALHLDGMTRASNDYEVPGFLRSLRLREAAPLAAGTEEAHGRVPNSGAQALEAGIGTSYVLDNGYMGASFSAFGTQYGTVAEPDITIHMNRQRLESSSELRQLGELESVRIKSVVSRYQHQEIEGGDQIATTFMNIATENRVEFKHRPMAAFSGILGIHQKYFNLSVAGEEAFIPTTQNSSLAAFLHEEGALGDFTPSFGLRFDPSWIYAQTDSRFGSSVKWYAPGSMAIGALYRVGAGFSLGLNSSLTSRAPNYQELFANGPHLATGIFEVGRSEFALEVGRSLELSVLHESQSGQGRINLFAQSFANYIALNPTGTTDASWLLPIYEYQAVNAFFAGAETEYHQRLPWKVGPGFFEVDGKIDFVRGLIFTDTTTSLPRITPIRETLGITYRVPWALAEAELQRSEKQLMTAPGELPTDAYTLLNVGIEVPLEISVVNLRLLARLNNVFDAEARNHVSVLKDRAPLPGRNFIVGLQGQL